MIANVTAIKSGFRLAVYAMANTFYVVYAVITLIFLFRA